VKIQITRTTPYASLAVDFDPLGNVELPQVLREMDKVSNAIERREMLASDVRAAAADLYNTRQDVARMGGFDNPRNQQRIAEKESALAEAKARLAEADAPPPVSQVDIVTGEAAVAILERLRDLLGVESMGDVEAEVERMVGPDVLTEWPSAVLPGTWEYRRIGTLGRPLPVVTGTWLSGEPTFVDASRNGYDADGFCGGERFVRIREGKP
jgi:hypothetical protein